MDAKAPTPTLADPPDLDLVLRARGGDGKAFGDLVRRHQKTVFRIALRMVRNQDQAEDLTQMTFLKAFKSLHSFRPEFEFHPWLYRIAVNLSLTHLARRKRDQPVDISEVPESLLPRPVHEESPFEETGRRELMSRLESALEQIPPDQKLVFLLRVTEGLSYDEIARTLEIPRGTVMSRLSRAREALRRLLV